MSSFIVDTTEASFPKEWQDEEVKQRVGWSVVKQQTLGVVEVSFQDNRMFIDGKQTIVYAKPVLEKQSQTHYRDTGIASDSKNPMFVMMGHFLGSVWEKLKDVPGMGFISAEKLLAELANVTVIPDAILSFLLENQNDPAVRSYLTGLLRGSFWHSPSFWGTQYENNAGDKCVRALFYLGNEKEVENGEWFWMPVYLHNPQFGFHAPIIIKSDNLI